MISRPVKPYFIGLSTSQVNKTPSVEAPRAFVSIRPPGHHCSRDAPAGFCWVNNVAIAATQGASVSQILISNSYRTQLSSGTVSIASLFSILIYIMVGQFCTLNSILAHLLEGNGTQTYAQRFSGLDLGSNQKLRIFYGSLHDILSFPCEVRLRLFGRTRILTLEMERMGILSLLKLPPFPLTTQTIVLHNIFIMCTYRRIPPRHISGTSFTRSTIAA